MNRTCLTSSARFSAFAFCLATAVTLGIGSARAAPPEGASPYPEVKINPDNPTLVAQVKRGQYLVDLSDCLACHTAENGGKSFAGGLPIKTPYGTIYSTNITPDPETGIGKWTFAQFDQAVRFGDSPHGYLFAAMPYPSYSLMTKQQVRDMWEYIKRVPAVRRKNEPVAMPAPFRWRFLQFGWRLLFFKPAPFKANATKSAEWNRGRFIVQGPEHCGACHTPHNFLGAPKQAHFLRGSNISGHWAPDVSGAVTRHLTIKQITEVFTHKRGISGGTLGGDMGMAIGHSMRFMTPQDMRAIAVYLQSVNSEPASGPMPVPKSDVDIALGKKVYSMHCAACHMTGAGGAPKVGTADFAPLSKMPRRDVYRNVYYGVTIMPPKGGCAKCSDRELTSAIDYMIQVPVPKTTVAGTSQPSATAGSTTATAGDTGEKIYQTHCAACHATGIAGAPRLGDAAAWAPRLKAGLAAVYKHSLTGIGGMPAKGGCMSCSGTEVKAAVDYLVAHGGGKALLTKAH